MSLEKNIISKFIKMCVSIFVLFLKSPHNIDCIGIIHIRKYTVNDNATAGNDIFQYKQIFLKIYYMVEMRNLFRLTLPNCSKIL